LPLADLRRGAELPSLAVDLGVVVAELFHARAVPREDLAEPDEILDVLDLGRRRMPGPAALETGGVGEDDSSDDRSTPSWCVSRLRHLHPLKTR
jgi:hypothetical protein